MSNIQMHATRREFLRRGAITGALAGSPFAANLAAIGEAAAQSATDYKALVCLFQAGGNDNANTVVPRNNTEYAPYASARGALAIPQSSLNAIDPTAYTGPALGLHPALSRTKALVDQGRCAILANVGPLTNVLSKAQWNGGAPTVTVPFQLFSHSDQAVQWQTSVSAGASRSGWLGRIGDLMTSSNSGATSIVVSVAGNNIMEAGESVVQYQITTQGPVRIASLDGFYSTQGPWLRTMITENRTNILERELSRVARRSIDSERAISAAIADTQNMALFGGGGLGAQLRMVARMIAARGALGQRRQIFFVQHGGYDFHNNLLVDQNAKLTEVDAALAQFYQTTVDLGVANSVTTFTASDFGRGLQSNGDGSDHGWGNHHFIVGGAVRGNRVYGQWPTVAIGGAEDAGQGRLLPTTSVDQYASTLASWFGVSASNLSVVVPNIGRFATANLGIFG